METPVLAAKPRTIIGKQVKLLRAQGQLPIVLYGREVENKNLTVDSRQFSQLAEAAGSSTLIDLAIDQAKPVKVLIHGTQYDPITGHWLHADLLQVKLDEKLQTEIPLSFIGQSAAVVDLEGNLVTTKDTLKVEAFPQDLVSEIEVDISSLATFEDKLTVADIKVPANIEVLDDPEETLAIVTPPRSEEELEAELAPTTEEAEAAAVAATEEASTVREADVKPTDEEGSEANEESKGKS